jgi:DNA-binding CsgD family transcriptional regulator
LRRQPKDRQAEFARVIDLVFDAALDPAGWSEAINALTDAVGGTIGSLGSYDLATGGTTCWIPRLDPADMRVYEEEWAEKNVVLQRSIGEPVGVVIRPEEVMLRAEIVRTDFFRGYFQPRGMEVTAGAIVLAEDSNVTFLTVQRPFAVGDYSRRELDNFAALIPYVRRAAQMQHRLAAAEAGRTAAAGAFDRLRDGVVMVDAACRILFANRSADEILAEADGLRRDADRIAAVRPAETDALRRLIAGKGGELPGSGGRCRITRRDGRAALSVLVAPVRTEVAWITARPPAAILFITDPDRQQRLRIDLLGDRFQLTPAEQRVLEEIASGSSVEAAAERLGIRLPTVRTHIHRIFEKTGTRRQAELVGLVMQTHTTLRED